MNHSISAHSGHNLGYLGYSCICGYSCLTARALFKHIRRWGPGEPGRHTRTPGTVPRRQGFSET